jgi:hypothetical protein
MSGLAPASGILSGNEVMRTVRVHLPMEQPALAELQAKIVAFLDAVPG